MSDSSSPQQHPLCQECGQNPSSVIITQIVENESVQRRLCEACARRLAMEVLGELAQEAPLEEILQILFDGALPSESLDDFAPAPTDDAPDWWHSLVEFSADEDEADEQAEAMDEEDERAAEVEAGAEAGDEARPVYTDSEWIDLLKQQRELQDEDDATLITPESLLESPAQPEKDEAASGTVDSAPIGFVPSVRCPKCGTTWDRLKQDGRAGCAQCYVAFSEELTNVMEKMQKSSQHAGKAPRSAEKRQKRLMHLRLRRDHRLEMLQRRLEERLAAEDYEEAAKLRDKIRIISSTILE